MDFINEYALLFAVAAPVVAIVGLNVFLAVTGERGTLLLPGSMSFPSIEAAKVATQCVLPETTSARTMESLPAAANDERERQAA